MNWLTDSSSPPPSPQYKQLLFTNSGIANVCCRHSQTRVCFHKCFRCVRVAVGISGTLLELTNTFFNTHIVVDVYLSIYEYISVYRGGGARDSLAQHLPSSRIDRNTQDALYDVYLAQFYQSVCLDVFDIICTLTSGFKYHIKKLHICWYQLSIIKNHRLFQSCGRFDILKCSKYKLYPTICSKYIYLENIVTLLYNY